VPSDMVEITKTGKVSIKKTLTKMNNISKSNGYPSIKLVSSSDNKPHIIADGKEWNINQLKTNLKKANELATKNKGRVFKKKIVQPLKDNNFIENIKTNIKINKSIKATENKTKKLRELYNLFFTYDESSLKEAMFNVADNMNITLMKDAYTKSTKHNLTTKDIARNVYNKNIPIDLINDEYKKVASKGNNGIELTKDEVILMLYDIYRKKLHIPFDYIPKLLIDGKQWLETTPDGIHYMRDVYDNAIKNGRKNADAIFELYTTDKYHLQSSSFKDPRFKLWVYNIKPELFPKGKPVIPGGRKHLH